jgi:hypothetical protein
MSGNVVLLDGVAMSENCRIIKGHLALYAEFYIKIVKLFY